MENDLIYHEIITSKRTTLLFLVLTSAFFVLFIWRILLTGFNFLTILLLSLFIFFLFYSINYQKLEIHMTDDQLSLKFGLFKWIVPYENIAKYKLDEIPTFSYYGGAGIHFTFVRGRYRASFNFLEYSRVVIVFRNKIGPIQELSFSSKNPEVILKELDQINVMTQR